MEGALRRLRAAVKPLDCFAFAPIPRHVRGTQFSLRGLIGSAILWALFIAFIVNSAVTVLRDRPAVAVYHTPTDSVPVPLPPMGLTFRRNVEGRPLEFFYNDSFFRVSFEQVLVTNQDLDPRATTRIASRPCDLSAWAGWSGTQSICPVGDPTIAGRYQSEQYTFFAAHVTLCNPAAPFNSSVTGLPVTCASQEEIDDVLTNGRFNLLMDFRTFDHAGQFESDLYLYNPGVWQLHEGIYHKLRVEATPNYMWAWRTEKLDALRRSSERALTTDPKLVPSLGGGLAALTIYARLDSYEVHEVRQRYTILDLLGAFSAVYSALFTILALYFAAYNRSKFYERYPHWADVGSRPFVQVADASLQADAASWTGGEPKKVQ